MTINALIPVVGNWVAPKQMRHIAPSDQAHAAATSALRAGQQVVALIGPASQRRLTLIDAIADAVSGSGETLYIRQPFPDPIELHECIRGAASLPFNIPLEPKAMARAIGVTTGPPLLVVIEEADAIPFESWQYLHLLCDSLAGGPPQLQILLGATFGFVPTLQQVELATLKVITIVERHNISERRRPRLDRLKPLSQWSGIIASLAAAICVALFALHWIMAPADRPKELAATAGRPALLEPATSSPSTALVPPIPAIPSAGPRATAEVDAQIHTLVEEVEQHVERGDDYGGLGTANLFKQIVGLLGEASPEGRRLVQNLPTELTDRARRLQAYADVLSAAAGGKPAKSQPERVAAPAAVPGPVGSRTAWKTLPANAPPRVIITYSGQDPSTQARIADLAVAMRRQGLSVDDPIVSNVQILGPSIGYFFATDRAAAGIVGDRFGSMIGTAQLDQLPKPAELPVPGTIQVSIP